MSTKTKATPEPARKIKSKYPLVNPECEFCMHARIRKNPKPVVILCTEDSPGMDKSCRAVWPIVEPTESCGRFEFNNG